MLRNFLDNIEERILSNNKLKKFHPLHDALDTFLYSKNTQTLNAPFVRDSIDLKRTMIIVVLALLPSLIFGTYNVGLQSPENTSTSFIDCFINAEAVFNETLFNSYKEQAISISSA